MPDHITWRPRSGHLRTGAHSRICGSLAAVARRCARRSHERLARLRAAAV